MSSSLDLTAGMTIEAWVFPTVTPSNWRTVDEIRLYNRALTPAKIQTDMNTPRGAVNPRRLGRRVVIPGWLVWCWLIVALPTFPALAAPPGTVEPIKTAPEVLLTTVTGNEFRLSQQRGKVVVVTFGFTLCPDVCGMTLAKLSQVRARLKMADDVLVVFITLDPERDTPALLRVYTRRFDPTFVGLTGTPRAVALARNAYGVLASRRAVPSPLGYLLDHSTFVFVVDRAGNLRLMFPAGAPVEELAQGIKAILADR